MGSDLFARGAFFRALGFAVRRDAPSATEVTRLRGEADAAIREATGPWYRRRSPGGGIEGRYIPATGGQTPFGLELAVTLLDSRRAARGDAAVRRFSASQFEPGEHGLDYDPRRYPDYGDHFRRRAPTRWVRELERLGAFAAAAAEEVAGQRAVPR
jgi:hypothetical protein